MNAAVIYWSGTGNTEAMAKAIARGLTEAGAEVDLLEVSQAAADITGRYEKLAFGCPSMGAEVLEEDVFDPFYTSIEDKLSGKKVALFGSYDWGDGEWMRDWQGRAVGKGALLFEKGLIQHLAPDEEACTEFGRRFAAF